MPPEGTESGVASRATTSGGTKCYSRLPEPVSATAGLPAAREVRGADPFRTAAGQGPGQGLPHNHGLLMRDLLADQLIRDCGKALGSLDGSQLLERREVGLHLTPLFLVHGFS